MTIPRYLVLAGGLSHERDVSLRSGRRILDALRSEGVEADLRDADGMARIMGLPARSGQELANRYRAVARRARHAAEHVFYGDAT